MLLTWQKRSWENLAKQAAAAAALANAAGGGSEKQAAYQHMFRVHDDSNHPLMTQTTLA